MNASDLGVNRENERYVVYPREIDMKSKSFGVKIKREN